MCTMSLNPQFNGVELYFSNKPQSSILDSLKAVGYRWHNIKKCWYAKQNSQTMELAKMLSSEEQEQQEEPVQVIMPEILHQEKVFAPAVITPVVTKTIGKVGIESIFAYSWGYEQTNVDFYQVVDIKGSSTVVLREISSKILPTEGYSSMAGECIPVKNNFVSDETFKKLLKNDSDKPYFSMKNGVARLTNETERHYVSWYA